MKQINLLVAVVGVLELFDGCAGRNAVDGRRRSVSGESVALRQGRARPAGSCVVLQVCWHRQTRRDRHSGARRGPGAPVSKAEVVEDEAGERILRVTAGAAQAEIALGAGVFVTVNPGKNAASVEVRAGARYVALPDFFADDVVFDPVKFTAANLGVPAENFLLQFIEGGDSIVMCIWPGNLKLPGRGVAKASGGKVVKEGPDPQVDLVFAGEGKARRVSAARIEFQNRPVYVGILEHKDIWHDHDASDMSAYKPTPIAWKRPFEARWRGDFVVAEGKSMADWPTRNQSFEFQSTSSPRTDRWWNRDTDALDARFAAATSNPRPEELVGVRRRERTADLAGVAGKLLHLPGRIQGRRGPLVPLRRQGHAQREAAGQAGGREGRHERPGRNPAQCL